MQTNQPIDTGEKVLLACYDMRPSEDNELRERVGTVESVEQVGKLFDVTIRKPDGGHKVVRVGSRGGGLKRVDV